jgi:hypothetical protein
MRKLITLIIVVSMASCVAPYHTKHQSKTIRNISRPHYGLSRNAPFHINHNVPVRKQGDANDKTVRKQTRRSLH